MTGTQNQIEWAVQIKARVAREFDRVANALDSAPGDRQRARALLEILADKRAEVMAREDAGYFIVEWQELGDQVRKLIAQDPRYMAAKAQGSREIAI